MLKPLLVGVLLLSGCAGWQRDVKIEEAAFQVLSAVDTAQTVQQARHPDCFQELGSVERHLFGAHPNPSDVVAYGVARGAVHFGVTALLERAHVDPWWVRIWQAVTIVPGAADVHHNWQIGLHIGSIRNCDGPPSPCIGLACRPIG